MVGVGMMVAVLSPTTPVVADSTVDVTLLATNDLHGHLHPVDGALGGVGDQVGGAAYLSSHLDGVRASHPEALFVDAGDMTGASPAFSRLFRDEPTVEAMNLMGLDATTVGNHEFDPGTKELRRNREGGCIDQDCAYRHEVPYEGADFTTLGANVTLDSSEWTIPPWTIEQVAGIDVGIVGLTTIIGTPEGNYDGTFSHEPTTEAVGPAVDEVVAAGADVVVLLWHDGSRQHDSDDRGVALHDPNGCVDMGGSSWWFRHDFPDEVDVVVDGHRHRPYVCDVSGGPLLTQAWAHGRMFTEITLTYDLDTAEVVARDAVNTTVTHDVAPDQEVEDLLGHYDALANGRAPEDADLDGDELGDAYEVLKIQSDPYDTDTDDDGLDDGTERFRDPPTSATSADTDGGGADDGLEVQVGTQPTIAADDDLAHLLAGLSLDG